MGRDSNTYKMYAAYSKARLSHEGEADRGEVELAGGEQTDGEDDPLRKKGFRGEEGIINHGKRTHPRRP